MTDIGINRDALERVSWPLGGATLVQVFLSTRGTWYPAFCDGLESVFLMGMTASFDYIYVVFDNHESNL